MAAVELKQISHSYKDTAALIDVSLSVESGELLALLGPSGCGKTTLLRSVAGLIEPSRGQITISNRSVIGIPTRKRPIGMVFQSYALFPNLRVAENIGFPLTVRKQPKKKIQEKSSELLELVGLAGFGRRFPHQLSGGQQQRVALARALAREPEVLLLDEPLSALDAQVRVGLRDEIRRIQQQLGITTLYVTHDQSEALAIADRIALMRGGKVEQLSAPTEIYEDPKTRFAAEFIGTRNALELPVVRGKIAWGNAFSIAAPSSANGTALAVFRPEDVKLTPTLNGNGSTLPGTVDMAVFLGSATRVYVRAQVDGRDDRVIVDLPSREARNLQSGAAVSLSIDSEAVKVFGH